MKNIGQYNQDLSVPRKKDIDSLEARVKTNEDNIAMAESDIEGLDTDVGTLKTDVSNVKTALSSKQDTIVGAASTIVEDNLAAGKVLVSDASGKVGVSDVTSTELSYLDGVMSDIQTQLNKKIEKVHDNDISWGGKNLSDEVSPIDAAMVSVIGGNKFALCKPQGITIEYTNDAGTTWKNYDTTDEIKINVISGISKTRLYYGKKTESSQIVTADDMLRITVNAFTCGVYTSLRKILIEFATEGSINDSVKIESATIGDQEAFTVVGTYAVRGNSGWNSIPYSKNFGAYTLNQTSNVGVLRFTFSTETAKGNPSVQNLILNGITNYVNPNKLSATGHLYSYDYQQNAIFPAKLTATSFEGDGSALTNISYPVTSVNTKTGAVVLTKSDIGLSNVDNVKQYSASNPPPYPVTSVNGQTGAVTLGASDIGALPLTGGTLTGPLVLGNEDAQIKIGEAGVIFNPSQEEQQIVISDSHYATQYITLSSSQTKIVGGTQFTNTNMTLAPDGITIQKIESGVPSTATLSGISDGVNANDAVNVNQLNASIGNCVNKTTATSQTLAGSLEAKNSVKSVSSTTKNSIELLSSDVVPAITGTDGQKEFYISFIPQYSRMEIAAEGEDMILSGIKAGTSDNDAVNYSQLQEVKNSIPDTSNFAPATAGLKVLSDTGGTFQYLGSVTTKLYYYSFTSQYSLPNNAVLLDISLPYSSTIGIFKVMCSYIQSWSPAKIWFMSMNYVTDFTHDSSTKIYYMLA